MIYSLLLALSVLPRIKTSLSSGAVMVGTFRVKICTEMSCFLPITSFFVKQWTDCAMSEIRSVQRLF